MIKESLFAIGTAARSLARDRGALAVLAALYAALLASVYMFFATREATAWQLLMTAVYAALAPLLFFLLQSAAASYAAAETRPGRLLGRALAGSWKIFLVSLPLIALAVLTVYLTAKLQTYLAAPAGEPTPPLPATALPEQTSAPAPMRWQDVLLASTRLLLLGVALPVAAACLWLAVARDGLRAALKASPRVVARALAPRAVLVYAVGLVFFGLMPYFIVFTRTPVKNGWAELVLFGLRLALAFLFTLCGWVVTLGALARVTHAPAAAAAAPAAEEKGAAGAEGPAGGEAPLQT